MPFPEQLKLSLVTSAYVASPNGTLSNEDLYEHVARATGRGVDLEQRHPIGASGKRHSVGKRALRWHQQTLKHLGILRRVPHKRGVWELCEANREGLHRHRDGLKLVGFSTRLGVAVWADCSTVFAGLDVPVSAVICSPPYPLRYGRAYGNVDESAYTDFICRALEPLIRHLAPGGSICINLSNDCFIPGQPARSLYRERLTLALADRFGLVKMDEFIWDAPKPPGPIEWASKARVQLNVGYEVILWMTNDPRRVKANICRVLQRHSREHVERMKRGTACGRRDAEYGDGAHRRYKTSWSKLSPGRIPRNVLEIPFHCTHGKEHAAAARALGLPRHGARFPIALPRFLIEFLTEVGDLVVDPFAGSLTTGKAAEETGRRWIVVEQMLDYIRTAAECFRTCDGFDMDPRLAGWPREVRRA